MSLTDLTEDEVDVLLHGCDTRMETITEFRNAPNIHQSDDWTSEEEAIDRCRGQLRVGGSLKPLSKWDLSELLVGLQLYLLNQAEEHGLLAVLDSWADLNNDLLTMMNRKRK